MKIKLSNSKLSSLSTPQQELTSEMLNLLVGLEKRQDSTSKGLSGAISAVKQLPGEVFGDTQIGFMFKGKRVKMTLDFA